MMNLNMTLSTILVQSVDKVNTGSVLERYKPQMPLCRAESIMGLRSAGGVGNVGRRGR